MAPSAARKNQDVVNILQYILPSNEISHFERLFFELEKTQDIKVSFIIVSDYRSQSNSSTYKHRTLRRLSSTYSILCSAQAESLMYSGFQDPSLKVSVHLVVSVDIFPFRKRDFNNEPT